MKLSKLSFGILGLALALCLPVLPAHAQATRTWVSGVGDDANPCSRTAPCKTFAGAISKTATSGEINCLDPGGFGAVTITKSIAIDCSEVFGSVLVSGTNGIVISGSGIKVLLRNLDIQGLGTGLTGINILAATEVVIDHCRIAGFITAGISYSTGANVNGQVLDTAISQIPVGIAAATSSGTAHVAVKNARIEGATSAGLSTTAGGAMSVSESAISNSAGSAVVANGGSIYVANSIFDNNLVTFNAGSGGTIFVSNNDVTNTTNAFNAVGTISSAGNNRVTSGSGSPNGTAIPIK
jgi:hypothetical protein